MRHADHCSFLNQLVRMENVLDFLCADILAAANDEILLSAGNDDVTRFGNVAEIACQKKTIVGQ